MDAVFILPTHFHHNIKFVGGNEGSMLASPPQSVCPFAPVSRFCLDNSF